ncbi:hypothetical protein IWW52_005353, partial [Coemansia sp. RSA 2704]
WDQQAQPENNRSTQDWSQYYQSLETYHSQQQYGYRPPHQHHQPAAAPQQTGDSSVYAGYPTDGYKGYGN